MNKDVKARTLQRLEESGGGGELGQQRRRLGDASRRDVDVKGEAVGGSGPPPSQLLRQNAKPRLCML